MGRSLPFSHFTTDDLPAADQFDAWRDKISVIFDVERPAETRSKAFHADVDAFQLSNLVVTCSNQDRQSFSIAPRRARSSGIDLIQIGCYRSGGYRGDADGTSIEGRPGDIQILDLSRPMQSIETASDMVCVFVPREILQSKLGEIHGLHGADLRGGLGPLLADYLRALAARLPDMSESDADAAAAATIDIIAACLRPTAESMRGAAAPIEDAVLVRAKRLIEQNLHSPRLTPDFLCRTLGVSRRTLYRLFEPRSGVHAYILRRRLDQIMQALTDPDNRQPISELGARYGFASRETFWRAFRKEYGVTPGDIRARKTHTRAWAAFDGDAGFDQWLRQLRA
jgi:AraC-like DNA-binding protein